MGNTPQLPLFYNNPTPLQTDKHLHLSLRKNFGFFFAKGVNAVPINLVEMPQVCHFYPIAFSPDGNGSPVAILGLRDNENLYLTEDGGWLEDTYIPAYVRRYPFIFSEHPHSEQLTLCVDMDPRVIVEHESQPFFNPDGTPSDLSRNALEFCESYHAAASQTINFSKRLVDLDLLVDRAARIEVFGGRVINFSGFRIIDESRLARLEDAAHLSLREEGLLPFIYAHLFSGTQWQRLSKMLSTKLSKERGEPFFNTIVDDKIGAQPAAQTGYMAATPIATAFRHLKQR